MSSIADSSVTIQTSAQSVPGKFTEGWADFARKGAKSVHLSVNLPSGTAGLRAVRADVCSTVAASWRRRP